MIQIQRLTKYLPTELKKFKGSDDLYIAVHFDGGGHKFPLVGLLKAKKLSKEWKSFYNSLPRIAGTDVITEIACTPVTLPVFTRYVEMWVNTKLSGTFNEVYGDCTRLLSTLEVTDFHVLSAILYRQNFVKNLDKSVAHIGQSLPSLIRSLIHLYYGELYECIYEPQPSQDTWMQKRIAAEFVFNKIAASVRDKVIGLISRGILFHSPMNTIWIKTEFIAMMDEKNTSLRDRRILLNWKNYSYVKKLRSQDA